MEHKSINLELKDIDSKKRTAVIAHAVYNSIDRLNDISCKGMFDKTWRENKNIDFLFNHDPNLIVGNVLRTFDDEEKAYTEVKFGQWTLGNDVLEMADSGVLRGASFGYVAEKKEFVEIKGRRVRKLKEVFHGETSLLTLHPVNPLAGIVSLKKALDQKDVNVIVNELQDHLTSMERFCRDTTASDECIKSVLTEIKSTKQFLSEYNTAFTQQEPDASADKWKGWIKAANNLQLN